MLPPVDEVSEERLNDGLANLIRDGMCGQACGALTSGVLLVGYALALGASNLTIGLLAAFPFLAQMAQVPGILLVERLRARKAISVAGLGAARMVLVPMAALPFLGTPDLAQGLLVAGIALNAVVGGLATCAWNSWMHDLVPERILGRYFGKRLFFGTAAAMGIGLAAGFFVDWWDGAHPGQPAPAYSFLFVLGGLFGGLSTWYLAQVPEPRMSPPLRRLDLVQTLSEPFRDVNFRRLIWFLGSWQFATNLAAPFFTVYLVRQLGYDMTFVTILMVISQLANVLVLRTWGMLSDRFSNKAVLRVCGPAFLACIFAWTLVAMPEKHRFTEALLVGLHVVMGMTAAGINLAAGNIGLKLAPRGRGTAYLAAGSIVNALGAGIAPIIGGLFADDFAARELSLVLHWVNGPLAGDIVTLRLRHWDFFFLLACALGLYALHRLTLVREEEGRSDRAMMQEVILEARRTMLNLSSVAGLRAMASFPFGRFVQAARRKRATMRDA